MFCRDDGGQGYISVDDAIILNVVSQGVTLTFIIDGDIFDFNDRRLLTDGGGRRLDDSVRSSSGAA